VVVFEEVRFLVAEVFEPGDALLVHEPILVAGASPFGEVLVGDGFAVEEFGENLFGFGQVVHPWKEGAADFAVVEALVELFADWVWQTSYLADSGDHKKLSVVCVES